MHARRTSDGQTEVSALSVIRDQIEREIARVERDGSSEQDGEKESQNREQHVHGCAVLRPVGQVRRMYHNDLFISKNMLRHSTSHARGRARSCLVPVPHGVAKRGAACRPACGHSGSRLPITHIQIRHADSPTSHISTPPAVARGQDNTMAYQLRATRRLPIPHA